MGYKEAERKIKSFENNRKNLKQEMDGMFTRLDYIENQYRRTNILIDETADENRENWSKSQRV